MGNGHAIPPFPITFNNLAAVEAVVLEQPLRVITWFKPHTPVIWVATQPQVQEEVEEANMDDLALIQEALSLSE